MKEPPLNKYRYFLKDSIRKTIAFKDTDQNQGVPAPPIEKPYLDTATLIDLPGPDKWDGIGKTDLTRAIGSRKSHRVYLKENLALEELAYLLWCTQGVRGKAFNGHSYRNVPSAGCRHAFETYLAVFHVDDIEPGYTDICLCPINSNLSLRMSCCLKK